MDSSDNGAHGGPLRVAVVGAGPAGLYAALELLADQGLGAHVDMFDRLPTPYGLVRFGVAPDHQKIKSVINVYERGLEAAGDRFRLFGNVELGTAVTLDELRARYHAVVLTFGAQSDRELGIPGEDLPGVYAAREFVAWYNGHPDYRDARFDLTGSRAMVVGIGNVAIDVARILTRTPRELGETDITPYAEAALDKSTIHEVDIVARRGPLQAACTPVELRELTRMEAACLVVSERDLRLDPLSHAQIAADEVDRQSLKNVEVLRDLALREPEPGREVLRMRFYLSPVEFLGTDRVEAVRVAYNTLEQTSSGYLKTVETDETEVLPCDVVFRAIGYLVAPVPGVPYDPKGRIPHDTGHVLDGPGGAPVPGLYVAGWAKRGPSGVIGTNKPDAVETVAGLLEAWRAGRLPRPAAADVTTLLAERGVEWVDYADWKKLDAIEVAAGAKEGRPRVKLTSVPEMLQLVGKEPSPTPASGGA